MEPSIRELFLVHGAGSGPWIFDRWHLDLPDISLHPLDLHRSLDVARASMEDYCAVVVGAMDACTEPAGLCGWSMGGLVAMMASLIVRPAALVLLEPSPPAQVQGLDPGVTPSPGTFSPELIYGAFPAGVASRAESFFARAQRERGISVPKLHSPTLVIAGDDFRDERGARVAQHYLARFKHFPGLGHWDLILDPNVRRTVAAFLETQASRTPGP